MQGFRVDDAKDAARPWQMRRRRLRQKALRRFGKPERPRDGLWALCGASRATAWLHRSRLRKAAYNRLSVRLEHLLLQLKTMSSFSDTQMSLRDLLSFTWAPRQLMNRLRKMMKARVRSLRS